MSRGDISIRRLIAIAVFALIGAAAGLPSSAARAQLTAEEERIDSALRKADQLEKEGKYAESIALLEATIQSARRTFAADHPAVGAAANGMGCAYAGGGRRKEAEACFREALKIALAHPAETGTLRLSARNNLVEVLLKEANYTEALPLCEESLKGVEEALGPDDWRTNMARDTLAKVYLNAKRPADAIPVARLVLKYALARFKADDPETIPFRNTLSMALLQAGQYPEAETLFRESLAIAEKRLTPEHEFTRATLSGLAGVCQHTDRNEEAAGYAARASGAGGAIAAGGRPREEASDYLAANNQATTLMLAGQFEAAERGFLRALELSTRTNGADHPETSKVLSNLAQVYTRWAKFADAERYAQKALAAVEKNPGPGTVDEAKAQLALAAIYSMSGRYDDAEPLLAAGHATLQDRLEPGHPETLLALHNLSSLYWATNRYDKAVIHGERAFAGLRERNLDNTSYAALILLNLGQSYTVLARLDDAEDRLVRAAAIFQKLGRVNQESAAVDNALAGLYLIRGKTREAEALYRRAVDACERWYGSDHPDTMAALDNLATFYACQSNWGAAADLFESTRKLRRAFLARTLPALSDDDQFSLIEMGEQVSRDGALSLALMRRAEPGDSARSAEWVLNSKAVALRAQAERAVLARDATNPEAARLLAERESVRSRLAMADPSAGKSESGTSATGKAYSDLVKQEQDLSRQLGLALKTPSTVAPWAGLEEVRNALPADAVLVEFVRIRVVEYASDLRKMGWRPARYAAWVIPPTGRGGVALVDLGPADAIDSAVSAALRAVQADPGRAEASPPEPDAERAALAALGALSELLLTPLRTQIEPAKRWVLSPDSALWLVPWAALPLNDGRYAVEDHLIFLTSSGRDLLESGPHDTTKKPAIIADPDYDLSPSKVLAKAHELSRVRPATVRVRASAGKTRSLLAPGTVDRLDGFRDEALAVAPLMKSYTGLEPEVFLDAAASETVFKGLHGPRALLISTHGFFQGGPEVTDDTRPLSPGPARRPPPPAGRAASPLLRCGLALAGFNASPGPNDIDDGLLTGLEVVGADLRGTEIVVLSACETGLGEVRSGEGVAGLRQSFQLAGAGAVVATLWKVQDRETYQLIACFFQGMARRRDSASALREAQLALIADRRARLGAAHPHFWAAFSLTGFPGPKWRDEALPGIGSAGLPTVPQSPPAAAGQSRAISPVTGLPEASSPWSDSVLAIVLLAAAAWAGRWWWMVGKPVS